MRCDHDWRRPDKWSWWDCTRCDKQMHPSWTPESRDRFVLACELIQLELTPLTDVVERITETPAE